MNQWSSDSSRFESDSMATRGAPIGNTNRVTHGYYKAKAAASRAVGTRLDGRFRMDKAILEDRAQFKRLCGRKLFTLKRKLLWQNVEKYKRILNAVEPVVFARPSLVNRRRNIIMPMCMDYVALVGRYQDAIMKVFDGLPADGKPELDPLTRLQRAAGREERRNKKRQEGNGKPSDDGDVKDTEVEGVDGGGGYPT
jgi:hypothetical protein